MFNRNAGIILLIALAAGWSLLAAQQVFAPKPPANARPPKPSPCTPRRVSCPTSTWPSPTAPG